MLSVLRRLARRTPSNSPRNDRLHHNQQHDCWRRKTRGPSVMIVMKACLFGVSLTALPVMAEPPQAQTFGQDTSFEASTSQQQTAQQALPQGPWYQVEVYIFRQPYSKTDELWPARDPVNFSSDTGVYTINPQPMANPSSAFQQVSMGKIQSYDVGQLLIESRRYTMLYKAAWQQPFVSRGQAPVVFIAAGQEQADNRRELEGILRLHKGRYLHVDAHLVLGKYEQHFKEIVTPPSQSQGLSANSPLDGATTESTDLVAQPEVIAVELFELKESRRMRSGELHYLDHPKFGMLIQVNRIEESQG